MECERYRELMMASLDGEICAEDRADLEAHLAECPDCRQQYEELRKVSELVDEIELPRPSEEDMMKYWPGVYAKIERGAGWSLLVIGAVIWLGYGVFLFITDPTIGSLTKFLVALPIVGLLVLLISVVRERIAVGKTERYKEVER